MKQQLQKQERRVSLLTFLPLAASILLHSLLLTPLYLTLVSDAAWRTSRLPQAISYLQLFLEYAFFWLLFAFLIRVLGKWRMVYFLLPIFAACLFRQGLELVMGYAVMGFPTWSEFCEEELLYTVSQIFFDCLLIAVAIPIIKLAKKQILQALLLAGLPVLFQIISLVIMFFGYDKASRELLLPEAGADLIFHILCFCAGFGVILLWSRLLGKEAKE